MEAGIIEIEQLVAAEQIQEARDKFRCFLRECAKCTKEDATYGDILSLMAERTSPYPHVGALLLRYIAVPQLFPESNRTNQISRSILSICEKALPDICRFLHVHERRQTFDKFSVLVSTHYSVCTLLAPLKQAPIDVISLLGFRQSLAHAINHSVVKQYCDAFDITHVRAQMEIILSKIARLKTESESIPLDLRDVQEIITKELQYCSDQFSFLTEDYYRLFLLSVAKAIDRFSNETRGRFTASLLPRIPSSNTLSKRYPSARNRQGNYRFYSFGQ